MYIDSSLSATPSNGKTVTVSAGGDFQAAINSACLGDTIVLTAGATFVGNFTLPAKTCGTGWITIRTSAIGSLPAEGKRVGPQYAQYMPKILTPANVPAIDVQDGAHFYRLIGLEIGQQTNSTYALVTVGDNPSSVAHMAGNIIIDRSYIHGSATTTVRRCIALNGAGTAIVDSYLADCHEKGADSQAIAGWSGTGPYKIVNNFLEGAGENILFGGADPSITNVTPSDIEIRDNYVSKQLAWQSSGAWTVKNLFELKNAKRVIVDHNVFRHNWADGQSGSAILFTPRNQDGTAPWSVVSDVAFTNNWVDDSEMGINLLSSDNLHPSLPTSRVLIVNNLLTAIRSKLLQIVDGGASAQHIVYAHNTMLHSGTSGSSAMLGDANIILSNSAVVNNIFTHAEYGFFGGGVGEGTAAINAYTANTSLTGNAFIAGGNPSSYPAGNFFPASISSVGFVNFGTDYRLSSSSLYHSAGTDGKDLGASLDPNGFSSVLSGL